MEREFFPERSEKLITFFSFLILSALKMSLKLVAFLGTKFKKLPVASKRTYKIDIRPPAS
jgi:hypothetical protein